MNEIVKGKISYLLLLVVTFATLTGCYFDLTKRYKIPLHEGNFTSDTINYSIDGLGTVTHAQVELTTLSQQEYDNRTINKIRDYAGESYYDVKLTLIVNQNPIEFSLTFKGTNNNQPDSYVFGSEYNSKKVIVLLIVNPHIQKDDLLDCFELRFHIYETGPQYTFTTNLMDSASLNSEKTKDLLAEYDYGLHIEGKITLLLGDSFLFFNPALYGISEILAGDSVTIVYTGEYRVLVSYPSQVDTSKMTIKNVNVDKGNVIELTLCKHEDGSIGLSMDEYFYPIATDYVVNEDGTFCEWETLSIGTKLYGINPITFSSQTIIALYSYKPR